MDGSTLYERNTGEKGDSPCHRLSSPSALEAEGALEGSWQRNGDACWAKMQKSLEDMHGVEHEDKSWKLAEQFFRSDGACRVVDPAHE